MTAPLTHQLHQSRVHDFHRYAARHRALRPTAEETTVMQTAEQPIAIRRATAADTAVVTRLAALDSADVPAGDVLIAFVGEEPQAATEIETGLTVADPFRPTADLVDLLQQRARHLRTAGDVRRRLPFGLPGRVSSARG